MSGPEQQANLDGQQARLAKRPITENPFPMGCCKSRAWSRGWREIDDMERKDKRL